LLLYISREGALRAPSLLIISLNQGNGGGAPTPSLLLNITCPRDQSGPRAPLGGPPSKIGPKGISFYHGHLELIRGPYPRQGIAKPVATAKPARFLLEKSICSYLTIPFPN
jgi:hypothetical protein